MLALELTRSDGQVTLRRAAWRLWDSEDGEPAQLWSIRAECGCGLRGAEFEACRADGEVIANRVIQLDSHGIPEPLQGYESSGRASQAKS